MTIDETPSVHDYPRRSGSFNRAGPRIAGRLPGGTTTTE